MANFNESNKWYKKKSCPWAFIFWENNAYVHMIWYHLLVQQYLYLNISEFVNVIQNSLFHQEQQAILIQMQQHRLRDKVLLLKCTNISISQYESGLWLLRFHWHTAVYYTPWSLSDLCWSATPLTRICTLSGLESKLIREGFVIFSSLIIINHFFWGPQKKSCVHSLWKIPVI